MSLSDFFTADQIDLISDYQEKWRLVYLNTQPIDRTMAAVAVERAYHVMGKPLPEIIFCPTPRAALDRLQIYISQVEIPPSTPSSAGEIRDTRNPFHGGMSTPLSEGQKVMSNPISQLSEDLDNSLIVSLENYVEDILSNKLTSPQISESRLSEQEQVDFAFDFSSLLEQKTSWDIGGELGDILLQKKMFAVSIYVSIKGGIEVRSDSREYYNSKSVAEHIFLSKNTPVNIYSLAVDCTWIDFAISVLNFPYDREKWLALKELTEQCGWIFAMSEFCIVCDRPANNN